MAEQRDHHHSYGKLYGRNLCGFSTKDFMETEEEVF